MNNTNMNEKVITICPDCGCEYTTTKANLVKFAQRGETTCPACRFKKVKAHKDVDASKPETHHRKKLVLGVNDLATKYPKVAAMWSPKNTIRPDEVRCDSPKKVIVVCPDCHAEYTTSIISLVKSVKSGTFTCPVCRGMKVVPGINDLATTSPAVAKMWSDKNAFSPREVSANSCKKVVVVCPDCGEEYITHVDSLVRCINNGIHTCPCCAHHKSISNNLGFEYNGLMTKTMNDGSKATIVRIISTNAVDVRFEDGFVLKHAPRKHNQLLSSILTKKSFEESFPALRHQLSEDDESRNVSACTRCSRGKRRHEGVQRSSADSADRVKQSP